MYLCWIKFCLSLSLSESESESENLGIDTKIGFVSGMVQKLLDI